MNVEINMWFQNILEHHAEQLATKKAAEEFGGMAADWMAITMEEPKGSGSCFKIHVTPYSKNEEEEKTYNIEPHEVLKDYIENGEY